MSNAIQCFKAYDIRGKVPQELNVDIAYRIGRAYVTFLKAKKVVVGHDIRLTSPELSDALIEGLTDAGVDVLNIGYCGTEEVYFTTFFHNLCGGICVTASHNPKEFNGMKLVREQAKPISGDNGLHDIRTLAELNVFVQPSRKGKVSKLDISTSYRDHLLAYVDCSALTKLKVVVNAGNGGAGKIIDQLAPFLPFEFIKLNHHGDGNFPKGVPNPLLAENRIETSLAIKSANADLGIAWDGDFDRCFFFDEQGEFIEGYYLVGLLAKMMLDKYPGANIVHDPRLYWNTLDVVEQHNGNAIQSPTGHAYMKDCMRVEDAIYGGEMSAHHYFKDFAYCDNGNIPWLLITALLCKTGKTLSTLIAEQKSNFPCSGEINNTVDNAEQIIENIEQRYNHQAVTIDKTDGLTMNFEHWRFNLRRSNTEPLLRLNVETKNDVALMQTKTEELLSIITPERV